MKRFDASICIGVFLLCSGQGFGNDTQLTIGTWGGPYEAAQQLVLFEPFERYSNTKIIRQNYSGGLDALRADTVPDVLDMLEEEALIACDEGLILRFDDNDFNALLNNQSLEYQQFLKEALSPCAVAHLTFSTLVAFNESAFSSEKPQVIADLFDVVRFPGKRALKNESGSLLEWALMAEGVPTSQVYSLLSTERGMRIALKRLDTIREHIIWWETPAEAVALLEDGKAVMASGYNGRFFDAWRLGSPIDMLWDGQIIDRSVWVVSVAKKDNAKLAFTFINYVLDAQRQAKIAERIPYGPTRKAAFEFIGMHPDDGISMSDHLPTASHHLERALYRDTRWYARTEEFRRAHFDRWLNGN